MTLLQVQSTALELGPLQIQWYAIIIVTGIVLAIFLSRQEAKKQQLNPEHITDFMIWALPISIIGARLYYVLFELPYYLKNPGEILAIWHGGLAIYGALIAGGITLYVYCQYHYISVWNFLDIVAPAIILAQGIGRWGNFMNHEAFGPKTTEAFLNKLHLPSFIIDNMYIEGAYRTPTFLYESLWNFLGFFLLIFLRRQNKIMKQGEVFIGYIVWYSFGRFFIEGLRTDSLYLFNTIRVSQLLSALLFIGGIVLIVIRRKKNPNLPAYNSSETRKRNREAF